MPRRLQPIEMTKFSISSESISTDSKEGNWFEVRVVYILALRCLADVGFSDFFDD